MNRRLNTTGIWIIVNYDDKKIWLGTGSNCETLLKAKLSVCHNYSQGIIQNSFYNVPVGVQEDIQFRNGNIVGDIYLITYNIEDIYKEISNNEEWDKYKNILLPPQIKESLRYITIEKLFRDFEPYATRSTIENCQSVYNRHRGFIYEMIKAGHIKMYKSNDTSYHLGKDNFDWEEVSMLNKEYQYQIQDLCEKVLDENSEEEVIESESNIEVEDIKIYSKPIKEEILEASEIEKLLTIEALLRDTTKEKLIEAIISEKAKEIRRIFK